MPQIPILSGIYAGPSAELRTGYPRNLFPVPKASGVSGEYLRPADGLISFATGAGNDRGGINWQGKHYRVSGTKLGRVEWGGGFTVLGDVGAGDYCRFDYGFDRLAIASGGRLYYWDGATLTQVTDPDLGSVLDVVWVDGYYMTTDGDSLVVTELNNPTEVNPLKYGSAEADPDPIKALEKIRTEVYAVNRYTTEVFDNVGGFLFPFARIEGAQASKGSVSASATCVFEDSVAFIGSGRGEPPGIYAVANGTHLQLSTDEIDTILRGYTEEKLASSVVESRSDKSHRWLYIHLPDQTLVYDAAASKALGSAVWFTLTSSVVGMGQYRARGFVWCYDIWIAGDPTSSNIGQVVSNRSDHFGDAVGWEFGTIIVYNSGAGAIFGELELVALPGRVQFGADPVIWTSYTSDGETYSQERSVKVGKQGEREKRIVWRSNGKMGHYRMQRFRGTSDAFVSFLRLEADLEALY